MSQFFSHLVHGKLPHQYELALAGMFRFVGRAGILDTLCWLISVCYSHGELGDFSPGCEEAGKGRNNLFSKWFTGNNCLVGKEYDRYREPGKPELDLASNLRKKNI